MEYGRRREGGREGGEGETTSVGGKKKNKEESLGVVLLGRRVNSISCSGKPARKTDILYIYIYTHKHTCIYSAQIRKEHFKEIPELSA